MDWVVELLAHDHCGAHHVDTDPVRTVDHVMNEILIFGLGIGAIIYISFKLGKERGTMLASARAVDMMIAMGYLKETDKGEIQRVDDE